MEWLSGRRPRPAARHPRRGRAAGTPRRPPARLAPLRALRPEIDTFAQVPAAVRRAPPARPPGADRGLRQQRPGPRPARPTRSRRWSRRPAPAPAVRPALRRAAPARRRAVAAGPARWCARPHRRLLPGARRRARRGTGWSAVREDANRVMDAAASRGPPGRSYLSMADEDADERRGWPAELLARLVESGRRPTRTGCSSRRIAAANRADSAVRLKSAASSSQGPGSTVVLVNTTPKTRRNHDHRRQTHRADARQPFAELRRPSPPAPSPSPATRSTTRSSRRGTWRSRCDPRPSSPRRPPRTSSRRCASRPGTACA